MSTLDEAEGNAEHLFLTVRDDFIMEKNFAGKVSVQKHWKQTIATANDYDDYV